ncbi:MAG: hypothetical protein ACE5GN_01225 [Waddliaceae bacterium]
MKMSYKALILGICLVFGANVSAFEWKRVICEELVYKGWKKLGVNKTPVGTDCTLNCMEFIPEGQTEEDFQELVNLSLYEYNSPEAAPKSMSEHLELVRSSTIRSYPSGYVKWNLIEQDEKNAIYEWQLLNEYSGVKPQHELIRIAFKDGKRIWAIYYSEKKSTMDPEKREKWIRLLREGL